MFNEILVGEQNLADLAVAKARGNKEGATVATELHGKYYEAAMRGRVFHAATVKAGSIIPVAAATLASVFTLRNPASSNKNIELISFTWGSSAATVVVNTTGLMIQRNLTAGEGVPTSLTAGAIDALGLGGTTAANFYTVATLTNAAVPGVQAPATPRIPFYCMMSNGATTDTTKGDVTHYFDGKIILGPDSLCAPCMSIANSVVTNCSLVWAEWPV